VTTAPEQPHITRCRISNELAFPVGYELLREHFGTSPHWSEARFYFSDHPTTFASEFARILRAGVPYCILRVERRSETHVPSHQPAHWLFTSHPVPRHLKSIARAALVAESFATLQHFISSAPTHANYYNRRDVIFHPSEGTCRTEQLWET
jgi:hypothetical protein